MKSQKLINFLSNLVKQLANNSFLLQDVYEDTKLIDNEVTKILDFELQKSFDYNFNVLNFEGKLDGCLALDGREYINKKDSDIIQYDLTIDAIEGTNNLVTKSGSACSVLLCTYANKTWKIPEMYLEKLFISNEYKEYFRLDKPLKGELKNLTTKFPDKKFKVIVLNKDRHLKIIETFKKFGVEVILINDGDFIGSLDVIFGAADFVYGVGCSTEAILTAALAINCNYSLQTRFLSCDVVHSELLSKENKEIEDKFLKKINKNKIFFETDFIYDKNPLLIVSLINDSLTKKGIKLEVENKQLLGNQLIFYKSKILEMN